MVQYKDNDGNSNLLQPIRTLGLATAATTAGLIYQLLSPHALAQEIPTPTPLPNPETGVDLSTTLEGLTSSYERVRERARNLRTELAEEAASKLEVGPYAGFWNNAHVDEDGNVAVTVVPIDEKARADPGPQHVANGPSTYIDIGTGTTNTNYVTSAWDDARGSLTLTKTQDDQRVNDIAKVAEAYEILTGIKWDDLQPGDEVVIYHSRKNYQEMQASTELSPDQKAASTVVRDNALQVFPAIREVYLRSLVDPEGSQAQSVVDAGERERRTKLALYEASPELAELVDVVDAYGGILSDSSQAVRIGVDNITSQIASLGRQVAEKDRQLGEASDASDEARRTKESLDEILAVATQRAEDAGKLSADLDAANRNLDFTRKQLRTTLYDLGEAGQRVEDLEIAIAAKNQAYETERAGRADDKTAYDAEKERIAEEHEAELLGLNGTHVDEVAEYQKVARRLILSLDAAYTALGEIKDEGVKADAAYNSLFGDYVSLQIRALQLEDERDEAVAKADEEETRQALEIGVRPSLNAFVTNQGSTGIGGGLSVAKGDHSSIGGRVYRLLPNDRSHPLIPNNAPGADGDVSRTDTLTLDGTGYTGTYHRYFGDDHAWAFGVEAGVLVGDRTTDTDFSELIREGNYTVDNLNAGTVEKDPVLSRILGAELQGRIGGKTSNWAASVGVKRVGGRWAGSFGVSYRPQKTVPKSR